MEDFEDDLDLTIYADEVELCHEVTSQAIDAIQLGLLANGTFHLALTGGTLGLTLTEKMLEQWNTQPDQFVGLHLWWSDERFVESTSTERNALSIRNHLTNKNIVVHESLGSDQVPTLEEAVSNYAKATDGVVMDLIILGVGPDGHVASLFPKQWDENETRSIIAVIDSPKPPLQRISFSMAFINSADEVWIVVAGASKGAAVAAIVEEDRAIPASHVHGVNLTRLIADTEAFLAE